MEKLNFVVDGVEKKLEYDERFSKGIFIVTENKAVKRNCETLAITVDAPTSDLELKEKISKIGRAGFLTIRIMNEWIQYIIMDYTDQSDFESLLRDMPRQNHEALRMAYRLAKITTLADLERMGGGLN